LATSYDEYEESLDLEQLFRKLGAPSPKTLAKTVEHFTTKEADKRDKIVIGYFGQNGVDRIVDAIATRLLASPRLPQNAKILDVGAGSGFFTAKIMKSIQVDSPTTSFYAMDLTPAMLHSLAKKSQRIAPFIGMAENIQGSIKEAKKHFSIPTKFDAAYSTLMLHHSLGPESVFKSLRTILKKNGKAIILDMCEHKFKEFKTEMGDIHLGFNLKNISEMARKHFSTVRVEKMAGISCESSGRIAEIFIASMWNCS
jgi:ubiquinone/menaquinone biosynthesis C-methylase UbiE